MPNVKRQNGPRPYWYIRYRIRIFNEQTGKFERKEKWHTLGYCNEMTISQPKRQRDELLAQVNQQVVNIREHVTFGSFVKIYERDHLPTLGEGTQAKYDSLLRNHLLPEFEAARLCDFDTHTIQAFLTKKTKDGASWFSRDDLRNLLSGIFTAATKWGYWHAANPVIGVTIGEKEWSRDLRPLSDSEVQNIIEAFPEHSYMRLILETLVSTGLRISELIGLKWKWIDLNRKVLLVRERNYRGHQGRLKSKRSRRDLPIPGVAERYGFLKPADAQPDDFVFQKEGQPLDERALLRQELKPVLERLKLNFEGFGWHTFRRTHLTLFSEEGGTAFETRDQAGHAKVETTMGYIRTSMERRRDAVSRVTERLVPASNAGIMRELGLPENSTHPVTNSNETGLWWARGDSNARPLPCQGRILC